MKREFIVSEGDLTSVVDRQTGQELATIQVGETLSLVHPIIVLDADFEDDQEVEVLSFILTKQSEGDTPFIFKIKLNKVNQMGWKKEKVRNMEKLVKEVSGKDDKPGLWFRLPGVRWILARLGF